MSAIQKHPSLIVAEAVLAHLEYLLVRDDDHVHLINEAIQPVLASFQNGREQGFSINFSPSSSNFSLRSISFAEYRSSDNIVVYVGPYSFQAASDEAYDNRHMFDTPQDAAAFIAQTLSDCVSEDMDYE